MDTRQAPKLLPAVEIASGPSPRHSIIWLHGLGADGNDFAPIVPELTRG
ncbi:phospholipase/carboxylesterase, partial [mine drainage metagenome]